MRIDASRRSTGSPSLRARFADSPLLVVTAHADAVGEADALGANAIIAKPFDVDVLLARLDELLS